MSLRLRLTLLYTSLLGGVILILGISTYAIVSAIMVSQIDDFLTSTYNQIITAVRIDTAGNLVVADLPSLNLNENAYIQIWGRDGRLVAESTNLTRFNSSIDPDALRLTETLFRDTRVQGAHLRVLNVPLAISSRRVGLIQVGTGLGLLDRMQSSLLWVSLGTAVVAMALAALAGWLVIGRALAPLEAATIAANQITRAGDLSRRIPFSGSRQDEIGQLVEAFNQTLSRLEQLFTAQRRFLADVSHELRTPLTVIKGNVGLVRRYGAADEESLAGIEQEVDRLTRLVGDLLLLAQAETGKIPLDLQPVALDTILLEVYQQLRVLAGDRLQVKLVDIDQVQVSGDRDRLKQVLLNLGGNAIKYTPPGGIIQLGLYQTETQARLVVSDNGPGIPAQDLPHIFERFYRGEKSRTRTRDTGSYGLGLSIAYWIIQNHCGRIEVDSKEWQGTTFCIWLPLDKPAPPAQS
jgi:heavy metal sensor kinase